MVQLLPLDAIEISPHNPRQQFDQEELLALANSTAQHGVLQPVIVTPSCRIARTLPINRRERQRRASWLARCRTIPAIIVSGTMQQLHEIQQDENLQRVQLTSLEEARAFKALQDEYGYPVAELSRANYDFTSEQHQICNRARREMQESEDKGFSLLGCSKRHHKLTHSEGYHLGTAQFLKQDGLSGVVSSARLKTR